ncbi:hypothetical protein BX616_002543 [Lobosporangium transversale]|nr:hypothetical protein BX616_002543 [Lobosporangium transversale]
MSNITLINKTSFLQQQEQEQEQEQIHVALSSKDSSYSDNSYRSAQIQPVIDQLSSLSFGSAVAAEGLRTASGRSVDPRRIKLPIAVAPMVDVTTSVNIYVYRNDVPERREELLLT